MKLGFVAAPDYDTMPHWKLDLWFQFAAHDHKRMNPDA